MAKQQVRYNSSMKLEGELFERALQYLTQELEMLKEQRGLSKEANKHYLLMEESLQTFKSSKTLADAMLCARIRG